MGFRGCAKAGFAVGFTSGQPQRAATVDGARHQLDVEPRRTLADALRDDLGLTGTHLGCEHGVCGACAVLVDGEPVRACVMFAVQADVASVATVEGMAGEDGRCIRCRRRSPLITGCSAGSSRRGC